LFLVKRDIENGLERNEKLKQEGIKIGMQRNEKEIKKFDDLLREYQVNLQNAQKKIERIMSENRRLEKFKE
jgi:uncharacterized protein YjbK